MRRFLPLAPLALFALVACATGSSETGGGFDTLGGGGYGGEGGSGASTTDTTSSQSSTTSTTTTGAGGAGGGEGGAGGGAGGSGAGGSGGSGGGQPTCDFTSPNQCANGASLQGIDGDQNHDVRTATGTTSKWFRVFVAEGVSSIFSYPDLSYTVSLQSPPGATYDLYVYEGDGNAPSCLGSGIKGLGTPKKVSDSWGDSPGSDDGTWLAIEVRYVSGDACGPSDTWTLTVEGHTL